MGQWGEEAPQSGSESLQTPISISEMTAVSQCPSDRSLGPRQQNPTECSEGIFQEFNSLGTS